MLVSNFDSSENIDVTLYRLGVISLLIDDTLSSVDSISSLSFGIIPKQFLSNLLELGYDFIQCEKF